MPPVFSSCLRPRTEATAARAGRTLSIALGLLFGLLSFAYGQPDTTNTTPPDAPRRSPADTTTSGRQPVRPQSFAPPLYGRPRTDSIPGRLPHVSVERILAEQPGSFLYDLGAAGWPHGWSHRGLAPHRVHLWLDGLSFDDPLTGRARFELLPPAFLAPPRTGIDPGGEAIGVHTYWRDYAPKRPVTELRYRRNSTGLHAIEATHSQKRRLDLFGPPGILQATFGYAGRKAEGVYAGSALRRERRIWGRLRYQTANWTVELSDRSSRHRVGAHGGVEPPGSVFESIYDLPVAARSVRNPDAQRQTFRNDLTARVRGPLIPGLDRPAEVSLTWTSHTFDARPDAGRDTTWRIKLNGGQARIRQALHLGPHVLTVGARGVLWGVAHSNVSQITGSRGAAHLVLRDSVRVGPTHLLLDGGSHLTSEQWYPSAAVRATRPLGPVKVSASVQVTGQRRAWMESDGFAELVQPLPVERSGASDRLLEGTLSAATSLGAVDASLEGFAHQIRNAIDLYATVPEDYAPSSPLPDSVNTVAARGTKTPVRRVGATLSLGWRRNAHRGLYATGQGTILKTLTSDASLRQARLARTLPLVYGRARIGARFVLFTDLITDLYVQARGWSTMNSRWFHPATGRLVVPPLEHPIPTAPGRQVGPSGTIDVHAEAHIRGATLFFTVENIQAGTQLQSGTFVVPVYPLPAQQFRFGVFWPIFN